MNYEKIYNNLIERAQKRIIDVDMEEHHIIPECFYINRKRKGPKGWLEGNPNAEENLVNLTPEEHYIAHQLLVKIYPDNHRLIHAAIMMSVVNENQPGRSKNKLYGWLRRRYAQSRIGKKLGPQSASHRAAIGAANAGENNGMFGKTWTNEQREKLKNRVPWNKGKEGLQEPWNKGKKTGIKTSGMSGKVPWNKGLKIGPKK